MGVTMSCKVTVLRIWIGWDWIVKKNGQVIKYIHVIFYKYVLTKDILLYI